jgi:hypothetical protein
MTAGGKQALLNRHLVTSTFDSAMRSSSQVPARQLSKREYSFLCWLHEFPTYPVRSAAPDSPLIRPERASTPTTTLGMDMNVVVVLGVHHLICPTYRFVYGNDLTGTIPSSIGSMASVTLL